MFLLIEVIKYTLFNVKYTPNGIHKSKYPNAWTATRAPLPTCTTISSFFNCLLFRNRCNKLHIWVPQPVANTHVFDEKVNHLNSIMLINIPKVPSSALFLNSIGHLGQFLFQWPTTPHSKHVSSLSTFSFFLGGRYWGAFFPFPFPTCGFPLEFFLFFFCLTCPSLIMSTWWVFLGMLFSIVWSIMCNSEIGYTTH